MPDINTASTFAHTNADGGLDLALQNSGQLPFDRVIENNENQDGVDGIQTVDSSLEAHEVIVHEGADIAANKPKHTDEAVLDNGALTSDAITDQQKSQKNLEEPHVDVKHIFPPAEASKTNPISYKEVLLSSISVECSQPHQFEDLSTLVVMQDGNICQTLHLVQASPTTWGTVDNIALSALTQDDITLCLQSKDGNDKAFHTITKDEIYASMRAEEGTAVEHEFTYLNGDDSIRVKMISTASFNYTMHHILRDIKALSLCFEETKNADTITQLIRLYETLDSKYSAQYNSSKIANLWRDIGNAYESRFELTRNIQDIEKTIFYRQKVVQSTPSSHSSFPLRVYKLGASYMSHFEHSGDIQYIEHAIPFLQKATESTPSSHPNFSPFCNELGNAYLRCFENTGNIQDIEYAISFHKKALQSTPSGHFELASQCNNLGSAYMHRFEHTGNIQDIEHAISYLQQALQSTPSNHSHFSSRCYNIGTAYMRCFEHSGNIQDIEHAISFLEKAVNSTPTGHPDFSRCCNNLGTAYQRRCEHIGNFQDIEKAISFLQDAAKSTPMGHADVSAHCNNLGNTYMLRFEHTGNIQDIEYAISFLQRAIQSTPSSHPSFPSRCSNLGNAYMHSFENTGNIQDIEYAISFHHKTIQFTPSGHSNLFPQYNNLGTAYMRCFEHTRNIQDIEYAISFHQKAVQSTSSSHVKFSSFCSNLGNAYIHRFQHTGDIQDIKHAIPFLEKAIQSTPSSHPSFSLFCNNLGRAYMTSFEQTGNTQDIDHSTQFLEKAIKCIPASHPNFSPFCGNLGNAHMFRFKSIGDIQDIEHAISHLAKAVQSTPSYHSNLSSLCNNLGNAYMTRFSQLHDYSDVKHSLQSYATGTVANGHPSNRMESACYAALTFLEYDTSLDNTQCLDYFSTAIGLLAEVAGLEQTINRRYSNLHNKSGIVSQAVSLAFTIDRPDIALEWLEQGRCLVWNQLGQLRTPINELRIRNQDLADRFIKAATALESDGSRPTMSLSIGLDAFAQEIKQQDNSLNHALHAQQYKQILDDIRSLPDFQDFLKPPQCANILVSIPTDGPIIVLHAANPMCSALALIAGAENALPIPLDNFSLDDAEKLQNMLQSDVLSYREVNEGERLSGRRRNCKSMSDILKELWNKVILLILEALTFSVPPLSSDCLWIWWCPTGPFAFLPLHAAGIYDSEAKPGSCVSDFIVSSYTPTVRSVSEKFAASATPSSDTKLLLISQPHTPGLSPIPSTTVETYAVETMMKEERCINTLLLENSEATVDEVKCRISTHGWVHFACHGIQDRGDPLQSGVHLHDGRLELLEIIRQRLPSPEFAFLSACQTSKGDVKLSDEVVHLAAGMLASGYRGVVGTMWSISDHYGPDFAKYFYQYLLNNMGTCGLDSTRAAYALDDATRRVREKLGDNESSLLTWVPYVHFGY